MLPDFIVTIEAGISFPWLRDYNMILMCKIVGNSFIN